MSLAYDELMCSLLLLQSHLVLLLSPSSLPVLLLQLPLTIPSWTTANALLCLLKPAHDSQAEQKLPGITAGRCHHLCPLGGADDTSSICMSVSRPLQAFVDGVVSPAFDMENPLGSQILLETFALGKYFLRMTSCVFSSPPSFSFRPPFVSEQAPGTPSATATDNS